MPAALSGKCYKVAAGQECPTLLRVPVPAFFSSRNSSPAATTSFPFYCASSSVPSLLCLSFLPSLLLLRFFCPVPAVPLLPLHSHLSSYIFSSFHSLSSFLCGSGISSEVAKRISDSAIHEQLPQPRQLGQLQFHLLLLLALLPFMLLHLCLRLVMSSRALDELSSAKTIYIGCGTFVHFASLRPHSSAFVVRRFMMCVSSVH